VLDLAAKELIANAVSHLAIDVDDFAVRTHIVVMPGLPIASIDLLAGRLGIPPLTAQAHYSVLRTRMADVADANGDRSREPSLPTRVRQSGGIIYCRGREVEYG
jgi:hypothetical protein